ncbi:MAG: hypothetical protein VZQ83_06950 [Eubacterium sp.]|nr:hypothetical protein [Eubacterium sp.]
MYKNRLRVALRYYEELVGMPEGDLSPEKAQEELERLKVQIGFFQHERLIHLIVTVLFGLATVITIPMCLITNELALLVLGGLFLVLLVPYIVHYYHLENGVQQLYLYYNKLELLANPGYKKIY